MAQSQAMELIEDVLQAREAIASGVVDFRVESQRLDRPEGTWDRHRTYDYHVEFLGDRILTRSRGPVLVSDRGPLEGVSRAELEKNASVHEMERVHAWAGDIGFDVPEYLAGAWVTTRGSREMILRRSADPRAIGMGSTRASDVRAVIGSRELDLSGATIEVVTERGRNITRVMGCLLHGSRATIWIDRERGPSLTRLEMEGDRGSGRYRYLCENEMRQYREETWFPERSVIKQWVNEKLKSHTTFFVESAFFGEAVVDESRFTLAGLDLVPGMIVPAIETEGKLVPAIVDQGGQIVDAVWNGSGLVPREHWVPDQRSLAPGIAWQVPFGIAVFLGVGMAVLVHWRSKRQTA